MMKVIKPHNAAAQWSMQGSCCRCHISKLTLISSRCRLELSDEATALTESSVNLREDKNEGRDGFVAHQPHVAELPWHEASATAGCVRVLTAGRRSSSGAPELR